MKKKVYTEQELKDKLWEMVEGLDFESEDVYAITEHPDYDKWERSMTHRTAKVVSVPSFSVNTKDLRKLILAIEEAGLPTHREESLKNALRKAQ